MQEYLTLNKLHRSGKIWWIKSLNTLRKWVEADKNHDDLLKTIIVGDGLKKRYYFFPENVDKYVEAFKKGEIIRGESDSSRGESQK